MKHISPLGRSLVGAVLLGLQSLHGDTIQVTGNLTGITRWSSTNEYVLNGFVYVLKDSELHIEPGTVVRGKAGTGLESSALFITQGAKIYANGTRSRPIIFTAEADDLTDPNDIPLWQRGLWGGIVLMGKSVLNTASDVAGNVASPKFDVFEGLPDNQVDGQFVNHFGGADDDDSSGVLRYVSIRHPGTVILPNKEINGLSLCGVGRGTKIEYIEVYASADDSVEFFGGTVNTKYMASIFSDDDNFDIDMGYRGKNQFWFAIQAPDRKDNGGEWNGEPSGLGAGNTPVGNFEIYNATYVGAGPSGSPTRALISRVYAAPRVFNSIFTEFGGDLLSIDATSGVHFTNNIARLQNNLWWNPKTDSTQAFPAAATTAEWVLTNAANNNLVADPMLKGIGRTNEPSFQLDPRLQSTSPALTNSPSMAPDNGFYSQVSYSGAFDTEDLWLADWSFASQSGVIQHRPALDDTAHTVQVSGNLSGTINWYRTNTYVLNGFVYVLKDSTLNIEPGTVIRGKAGTGLNSSALFITQGAKIYARGTAQSPIIFTSESDDLEDPSDIPLWQRGLWGGIVLMGKSVLNTASDVAGNAATPKFDVFEGLPDNQVDGQFVNHFGGDDDNDNSGVLRYVSIRNPGTVILPNKEINGLSLCAVGRGTTIEFVEVYGSADDSVEFFGGTVNTKYMASVFSDDDNFDIDMGYRGKNQFWFALQAPDRKDNGGEWNGEPSGLGVGNLPIGNFEIYNATYIGAGADGSPTRALLSRVYAAPKVFNSIFTGFGADLLNVDATSGVHFTNGLARLQNNVWWNPKSDAAQALPAAGSTAEWILGSTTNNNLVADPLLVGISRTNSPGFQLDPRLQSGSPALANSPAPAPNDGFYTPVSYSGAFKDVNWASDWTFAAEIGLISPIAAGEPKQKTTTTPQPDSVVVTSTLSNEGLRLSFPTLQGVSYQVEARGQLESGAWTNHGDPIAGTGSTASVLIPIDAATAFLRVSAR